MVTITRKRNNPKFPVFLKDVNFKISQGVGFPRPPVKDLPPKKKTEKNTQFWYKCRNLLVGGFNPFEEYARPIGHLPQIGVKIKKSLKFHHLDV